jgi:hypothetical protein
MATLSSVTSSLERAWSAIRTAQPQVSPAAMVVYLHPHGDRRGHYWPASWRTSENGRLDEVHVSSAVLREGGRETFHVLLHEAVHSLARATEVQDTSRQGRYHNAVFASLAEVLGLVVERDRRIGYTTTGITEACATVYRNAIADLDESIALWQAVGTRSEGRPKRRSCSVKLVCPDCGRIIRASAACVDAGPIVCGPCSMSFEVETPR